MVWSAKSVLQALCNFRPLNVLNLFEHRTKAVFDPKLMVGGVQRKVVLDESGFRECSADADWGLNFLPVKLLMRTAMLKPGRKKAM